MYSTKNQKHMKKTTTKPKPKQVPKKQMGGKAVLKDHPTHAPKR